MAVPTNERAEATSPTDITLRWTDVPASANPVLIYRSTDGVSFSLLDAVAAGVEIYEDTDINGLVGGTKYWYELSQDGGSTFTDDFATWTHECANFTKIAPTPGIPKFDIEKNPEFLNIMGEIVALNYGQNLRSTAFQGNGQPAYEDQCIICAEDGKVVLDCSKNCKAFLIITTVDITSITIIGCGFVCPPVEFVVPTGTEVGICGWPNECKNHGDDCFYGRVTGPTSGGSGGGSFPNSPMPNQPGGGNGPHGPNPNCPCPPSGELSIVCCCGGECLPNCDTGECCQFKICGGWGPFTIETTAGQVKAGRVSGGPGEPIQIPGRTFQLCPEDNPWAGDATGPAYSKVNKYCFSAAIGGTTDCRRDTFNCYGDQIVDCSGTGTTSCLQYCDAGWNCSGFVLDNDPAPSFATVPCHSLPIADACEVSAHNLCTCDQRDSSHEEADGCKPCELQFKDGATITVTDFRGTSAVISMPGVNS